MLKAFILFSIKIKEVIFVSLDKKYYISGVEFLSPPLKNGLYIVATPIGNLKDISIRSLEILSACDLILCEDTRTSAKLLNHYGIKTKKMPLHEHNEKAKIASILNHLKEEQAIALISDAGTPLISDPGFPLVRAVQNAGLDIFSVPGASAILAALTLSGLPTDKFSFFGFLPTKTGAKKNELEKLKNWPQTMVFYESPRRLLTTFKAMQNVFGDDRMAVIALELTKKFERTMHGSIKELSIMIDNIGQIKGEAVIIVAGADEIIIDDNIWQNKLEITLQKTSLRSAVDEISKEFSIKRKVVYDYALEAKKAIKEAKS